MARLQQQLAGCSPWLRLCAPAGESSGMVPSWRDGPRRLALSLPRFRHALNPARSNTATATPELLGPLKIRSTFPARLKAKLPLVRHRTRFHGGNRTRPHPPTAPSSCRDNHNNSVSRTRWPRTGPANAQDGKIALLKPFPRGFAKSGCAFGKRNSSLRILLTKVLAGQ